MTQKIYTRTGDAGETGLFGGGRVSKADPRVEAYGSVDELNAALGVALAAAGIEPVRDRLARLQPDLFAIGAHLATPRPRPGRNAPATPPLPDARIAEMEQWIDQVEAELPPLRAFIMPGGCPGGAALHLARTVCRRAERRVLAFERAGEGAGTGEGAAAGTGEGAGAGTGTGAVAATVVTYLNRLSDLLFVWARFVNLRAGVPESEWLPGR
jgi:cob(I)alamin adenosyltransferase